MSEKERMSERVRKRESEDHGYDQPLLPIHIHIYRLIHVHIDIDKYRSSRETRQVSREKGRPRYDQHLVADRHTYIYRYTCRHRYLKIQSEEKTSEQRERKTIDVHMDIDIYRSGRKKRQVSREKKGPSIRSNDRPLLPIHIHIYIYIYVYTAGNAHRE